MTPRIADYTNRKDYMKHYAKANREAINARKRARRQANKVKMEQTKIECPNCGGWLEDCAGNCIFGPNSWEVK